MSGDEVKDHTEESLHDVASQAFEGKKNSHSKLRRYDSLDMESGIVSGHQRHGSKVLNWSIILQLAFQSIGVVYGDLGTSPLYVFPGTFQNGVKNADDIMGAVSLIFYTVTLIPLVNYVFIVLRATDRGDGGTFALYSLICRYVKVGLIPNQQTEDSNVSNFNLVLPGNGRRLRRADAFKSKLENSQFAKLSLLLAALLGTSMVIGDGILTPCISVLSAVGGIKQAASSLTDDKIMWISTAILVCLFTFQRLGTAIVGYSFAPIMCVWYVFIGAIGFYNIVKIDPTVIKAVNPWYIIDYFRRNKKEAWISLGGTVLSITGSEALFAAVGHFTVRSVQICTCTIVYPAIVLCYFGQAAVLHHHPEYVKDSFYKSVPGPLYWPMFVVAVLAAIIASQALISGAFSVIQQSLAMGCFPRVKVMHTSAKYEGQVFIPEINYLLMLACVGVTLGFKTTEKMGNAYGIAVVFVMTLTSILLVLVMIIIWKSNLFFIISYVLIIGSIELIYLSSVMYKFDQGGYLPLAFSAILMTVMYVWNNVYRRKYYYELKNKVSPQTLKEIAADTSLCRIPGLAMFHSELVHGVPPIFKQYVANVPALHSVLVFVSLKSLPISKVPSEERFIFRRVEPNGLNIFRCVARYGYTDVQDMDGPLELVLVEKLKEFIRDYSSYQMITNGKEIPEAGTVESLAEHEDIIQEEKIEESMEREVETVEKACRAGVVHLIGESEVVAAEGAGIGTRVMINYAYNFMKRNLRQYNKVYDHISHKSPMYWPMFVVAVLAAIIASQAMISGSFSIIQQSLALGCFPRVKVMYTSAKYEGQVYIPEINYLLMLACVGITLGFRTTEKIGNAYGIAVVFVMTLTSFLLVLVMIIIWKSNIFLIISYVLIIGSVELAYLSSVLYKFDQGGYLPLAFAALLMTVMFVWNNVYRKKYYYELERKISPKRLKEIALDRNMYKIPGLAMFYSELVQGIPPIFQHYAANVHALHSVMVFVSMKSLPISKVSLEERFIFRRVEPKKLNVFRCVARYGYTDVQNKEEEHFESMLIEKLKEFITEDNRFHQMTTEARKYIVEADSEDLAEEEEQQQAEEDVTQEEYGEEAMAREIERVDRAWQDGVVHLLGENEVVAAEGAGILKRLMINYAFNFLKQNLRQYDKVFDHIPHKSMLKVGMTYEL
ncbi:hypothetical protein Dsin_010896 [Dipteronia sinensis]|uniref:Potassium transporter n=1 Tax=Dipteronia sinensis TaxID=43782 RepID=A0AAE0ATB7_9ROSI|nr:hypothetical protein Dsin_010896 [Dipteronia sinensis]